MSRFGSRRLVSCEAGFLIQKEEGAFLERDGLTEAGLAVLAVAPVLKPVVVDGALLDVVLVAAVLEEKLLVAPEGSDSLRARHDPSNQSVFATELGGLVVGEHLEHAGIGLNHAELVIEVVLISIRPAVDIIRLKVDHEWPVRVLNLLTELIVLGELHERPGTDVVSSIGTELTVGISEALVLGFSQDVGVSVLEEVVAGLAIISESSDQVTRGHTVTEELDAGTWASLGHLGCGGGELRDSEDGVLRTLENTCVRAVRSRDELGFGDAALRVNSLNGVVGSGVRDSIEVQVEILLEELLEVLADKESLVLVGDKDLFPDVLLLASSGHGLICGGIEVILLREVRALALGNIPDTLSLSLSGEGAAGD